MGSSKTQEYHDTRKVDFCHLRRHKFCVHEKVFVFFHQ